MKHGLTGVMCSQKLMLALVSKWFVAAPPILHRGLNKQGAIAMAMIVWLIVMSMCTAKHIFISIIKNSSIYGHKIICNLEADLAFNATKYQGPT